MLKTRNQSLLVVTLLTAIGAFLHFYNINWGAPYYFHPDERNIASAVNQLLFPHHMNPQFFAYGSLPIYVIYFTGIAMNFCIEAVNKTSQTGIQNVTFAQAIVISRAYSALFATLLIPMLFSLGKKLCNETAGLLAAFFATATVGIIQFAHFGTFELWLTFFTVLLFMNCISIMNKKSMVSIIMMGIIFGILIGVKVSSLALLPIPVAIIFSSNLAGKPKSILHISLGQILKNHKPLFLFIFRFFKETIIFSLFCALIFLATNPYFILDSKDFQSSMNYESSVAIGTEPVFYTQNFINTTPGIYQFLHVYPFLLNPLMTILFIITFIYFIYATFKHKNKQFILLIFFYLILFSSQAFLFVKWIRYMIPTLPFILLIVAIAIATLKEKNKNLSGILTIEISILILLNSLAAVSYFSTAFVDTDTRIAAVLFAQKTIPVNANILSEPSDLGVVPFQDAFTHIDTFSFYDLDNDSPDATEILLQQKLQTAQYIIIPSQRILQSRIANPSKFPKGYFYYKALFNGTLGYHKIYETPCDILCTITYLGDPVYWWEQTASVFDRPTIFIFKKNS
jgi:4-amino-4-deoxy-L-arabinose transferase-like glycosyltransferase